MNHRTYAALMATCVFLGACGGGEEAPMQTTAAVPACTPRVATVALYGDSTTRGPENPMNPFRPQALLQAGLNARFGPGAVKVELHAFGGVEVFDLVAGDRGFAKWPAGADADVAIVSFGVNEFFNQVTLERYRQGLWQIAKRPLMWATPLPVRVGGDEPYADVFRDVARANGGQLLETRGYVLGLPDWQGMLSDGIHPSAELYAAIVLNVTLPAVSDAVAPIRCEKVWGAGR